MKLQLPKLKKLTLKHVKHDLNIDDVVILPKNTFVTLCNLRCGVTFDRDIALKVKQFIVGDSKTFYGMAGEIIIFRDYSTYDLKPKLNYHFSDIEICASSDDVIGEKEYKRKLK